VTIGDLFARLLCQSEHRGPHATGAVLVTSAGEMHVEKAPLPAHRFVATDAFRALCASIGPDTTVLMGHTRWPTQGSHVRNQNNQPLALPGPEGLAVTHNGDLPQVSRLFARFGLARAWEVDSELLLRLAQRHCHPAGLDVPALMYDVAQCPGHLAAVLVAAAEPATVVFVRRDRPLHVAWHPTRHLLAYASEAAILERALPTPTAWQCQAMAPQTAWVVRCADPRHPATLPLTPAAWY
jgi:glutamine phosphoribosylpyrophosphate amidotransferase